MRNMGRPARSGTRWRQSLVASFALACLLGPVIGGFDDPVAASSSTQPGPPLRTPIAAMARALRCPETLATSHKTPILLLPGTAATPSEDFSWSIEPPLQSLGYPVCTLTFPNRSMGDMQISVEYVVWAIRHMSSLHHGKIAIIGHSQGATQATYALRFWSDLAGDVSDVIGYDGAYTMGTPVASAICVLHICDPAYWQLEPGSNLMRAMAGKPLPVGPAYTAYSTLTDEVVLPQPAASTLHAPGAANYILQHICPTDLAEHVLVIDEEPLFELTLDALTHPGPARLSRIQNLRCGLMTTHLPALVLGQDGLTGMALGAATTLPGLLVSSEPRLSSYLVRSAILG